MPLPAIHENSSGVILKYKIGKKYKILQATKMKRQTPFRGKHE